MFVWASGINIGSTTDFVGRLGHKDRSDPLRLRRPSHIEIPFIDYGEGLDPVRDWMIRKGSVIRLPHGINRVLALVIPADQFLESFAWWPGRDLDSIMRAANSHTFFREGLEDFEVVFLDGGMASAAVHVKENGIGVIEGGVILWPAVKIKSRENIGLILQTFVQKLNACIEL